MDKNGIVIYFFIYDDAINVSDQFGWSIKPNGELNAKGRSYLSKPKVIEPLYLQEPMSECCGVNLIPNLNTNICSKCHEQCSITYNCDKCQGEGNIGTLDDPDEHQIETIECEYCQGKGIIIED